MGKMAKKQVEFDGAVYKVKSNKTEIPDLFKMDRILALQWLCKYTYPRGYSKAPSPLTGLGGAIELKVK